MATVVVFALPAFGHVNPMLPVIRELVDRGERVIFYCTDQLRGQIQGAGAEFRPLPVDFDAILRMDKPRFSLMAQKQLECAEALLSQQLDTIRADTPDYAFVDFMCVWGRMVAQSLGLPMVVSASSFVMMPGMMPPKLLLTAADLASAPATVMRALVQFQAQARRLARQYRVERLRMPTDIFSYDGDMILVSTSRFFQPRGMDLDERFRFIGPCIAPRTGETADTLPKLDDRPLIYISLGTVFNSNPTFFRTCIEAFGGSPYQVVMSIGSKTDPAALGPMPGNILVRSYVPQLEVLERAAVFITHGGMNSTSEGIMHNVPLLVYPQGADQFVIAKRVEELGVGIKLRPHLRRPRALRRLVDSVVNDALMHARIRRVRDSFLQAGGAARGADELIEFRNRYARLSTPRHPDRHA